MARIIERLDAAPPGQDPVWGLHVWLVDDRPQDRARTMDALRECFGPIRATEIVDAESLRVGLSGEEPNLVITDHHLAWSDGLTLLREVRDRWPDLPVIMFTDSGNEEVAVEGMKLGLSDYVLKSADHASRLPRAVRSAVEESNARRSLGRARQRYRALFDGIPIGLFATSADGLLLQANPALCRMFGVESQDALEGVTAADLFVHPEDPRAIRKALVERDEIESEVEMRRADGSRIWVSALVHAVRGPDGEVVSMEGALVDVTERHRSREALQEAEARFRTLVEQTPAVIYVYALEKGATTYMSPQIESLLGVPAEAWIADPGIWSRQLHPEDRRRAEAALERTRTEGVPFDAEYRMFTRDGRLVWIHDRAAVQRDETGRPALVHGVLRDVTERRRIEEALRESENRYRSVVAALEEGIVLFDGTGAIRACNPAATRILGLQPEQIMGRPSNDPSWVTYYEDGSAMPPDAGPVTVALRTGLPRHDMVGMRRPGGDVVWLSMKAQPLTWAGEDRPHAVVASFADVTERRRAEEALRRSEARFRALIDNSWDMLVIVDGRGEVRFASPSVERTLGHPPGEFVGTSMLDLVHPDDRYEVGGALTARARTQGFMEPFLMRIRHRNGSWREVEVLRNNLLDEPAVAGLVLNLRDVTQARQAEVARLEAEHRFRSLVEQIPVVTYTEPQAGSDQPFYISPQIERWLGHPVEAWADDDFWESLLHPDDRDRVLERDRRTNATGERFREEYRLRARDGHYVWVLDESMLVPMAGGEQVWRGVFTDVTERRRVEDELRRSVEELKRVDAARRRLLARIVAAQEDERQRIAADIHDDSVQIMAAAVMRLQLLRRDAQPGQMPTIDRLERTMNQAIGRLRRMMFELRPPALDREGLASVLRAYVREAADEAGTDFELRNDLAEEPGVSTRTIVYRIAQEALTNVRKHARASRVEVSLASVDDGIEVHIADDGVGLPKGAERRHVSGHLGMTAMRERAELAGGWFRVRRLPEGGTEVAYWVPSDPDEPDTEDEEVADGALGGAGTEGEIAPTGTVRVRNR